MREGNIAGVNIIFCAAESGVIAVRGNQSPQLMISSSPESSAGK